jgi:1-acyl-sn-glycerol-3-phosphate acyltransferase
MGPPQLIFDLLFSNKDEDSFVNNRFKYLISNENEISENVKFHGNLNEYRGIILIANHPSHIDLSLLKRRFNDNYYCVTYCVSKNFCSDEEYIEKYNIIPYHYYEENGGDKVKEYIVKLTSEGKNVIVFPEGRCNYSKEILLDFKKGLFYTALENNINILPCSININSENCESLKLRSFCYSFGLPVKKPNVDIYVNSLIETDKYSDVNQLINDCFNSIKNHLNDK